jgi:hypothetical protein
MKFRKKPIVIDATQWFKNGDHPEDHAMVVDNRDVGQHPFQTEGKVVCRYIGLDDCRHCGQVMNVHGWVDTLEGGHTVCPGDWIITGIKGEHYPCKPDIFEATYEPLKQL